MHSSASDSDSQKTITLHDVAKAAGVSVITASRALSNPHKVSDKTIAKVRQAVQSTGYVPNLVAGSLKSRRSNTVGLLVPAISVAQFLPTVEALTTVLASHGYQVILGQVGYDYAHEERLIQTMVGRRVDGIVAIGLLRSGQARKMVLEAGTPLVETWDFSDRPADMLVGFSHLKVGSAVAGYFLAKGWLRVGLATGDDHRAMLRKEGFLATMPTAVTVATIVSPGRIALGRQALRDLLVQKPDLQAVFCSSDLLAQGVLVEAQARGLRIPEDLAICGFGDADFAAHLYPSLSSVKVDGAAIGRHAAQMVLARCQGQVLERPVLDLGFQIQERHSTATL